MKTDMIKQNKSFFGLALLLGLAFVLMLFQELRPQYRITKPEAIGQVLAEPENVDMPRFYRELLTQNGQFQLVDLRPAVDYEKAHLPHAVNLPFHQILDIDVQAVLSQAQGLNYLYAENELEAHQAWLLLRQMGYDNIRVIPATYAFIKTHVIHEFTPMFGQSQAEKPSYKVFELMDEYGIKPRGNSGLKRPKKHKVEGGC